MGQSLLLRHERLRSDLCHRGRRDVHLQLHDIGLTLQGSASDAAKAAGGREAGGGSDAAGDVFAAGATRIR